jgi:predicted amidohydrolase
VVVFPELSLTGYDLDAPPIAVHDPELRPVAEGGVRGAGGRPGERAARRPLIAMLAIDGTGVAVAYRKMW